MSSFIRLPRDFVFRRHAGGFVAHSISKKKARCPQLRFAKLGPIDHRTDLRNRVMRIETLQEFADMISIHFESWRLLGEISDTLFEVLLESLPQMRVEVPSDMWDGNRLGPGHMWEVENLRKRAKRDAREQVQARQEASDEFEQLLKYVRPIADSRSLFTYVD